MRYIEFRDSIQAELRRSSSGLTWNQLRERLDLPYTRPCPEWTKDLEQEIGLVRVKGQGRAYVWRLSSEPS
ncbi:hypothetical protein SAMN02745166_00164 [Prosthecobacter debontii]|uniref:Uncharacterized protein n=1 Tax=Prosthecobacter debontii TaxID=48467 RepID=A0A1T4WGD6_9BACT|nr:hypothetical protein [Prosthecobacter debontii]SKA76394.1 hypothetical protein SAMN02745166_00164 [Prosthecobacter debontii]